MPDQFRTQRPSVANPPTLFLAALAAVERRLDAAAANATSAGSGSGSGSGSLSGSDADADEAAWMLAAVARHTRWLLRTQRARTPSSSSVSPSSSSSSSSAGAATTANADAIDAATDRAHVTALRWRGRTHGHCLASGLDDYPRARVLPAAADDQHDDDAGDNDEQNNQGHVAGGSGGGSGQASLVEGHVDLHCWLVVLTRRCAEVAERAGDAKLAQVTITTSQRGGERQREREKRWMTEFKT